MVRAHINYFFNSEELSGKSSSLKTLFIFYEVEVVYGDKSLPCRLLILLFIVNRSSCLN